MRKRGKYNVLKCFGGVYEKYNNKGSFSGVLYVTVSQAETKPVANKGGLG